MALSIASRGSRMLEEILKQKIRVKELEDSIKKIEEEAGLPSKRKELKELQGTLETMLAEAVLKNVMEEGTIRIISAGRVMRSIKVPEFKTQFPDLFDEYVTVPITPVEDAIIQRYIDDGHSKKESKMLAEEDLDDFIERRQTEKWDILDLVGGIDGADH
jgi:hypothetical protein